MDDLLDTLQFIDAMPEMETGIVLKERGRFSVRLMYWLDKVEHKEREASRNLSRLEGKADMDVRPELILTQKARMSEHAVKSNVAVTLSNSTEYKVYIREKEKWEAIKGVIKASLDAFSITLLSASAGYFRKEML